MALNLIPGWDSAANSEKVNPRARHSMSQFEMRPLVGSPSSEKAVIWSRKGRNQQASNVSRRDQKIRSASRRPAHQVARCQTLRKSLSPNLFPARDTNGSEGSEAGRRLGTRRWLRDRARVEFVDEELQHQPGDSDQGLTVLAPVWRNSPPLRVTRASP